MKERKVFSAQGFYNFRNAGSHGARVRVVRGHKYRGSFGCQSMGYYSFFRECLDHLIKGHGHQLVMQLIDLGRRGIKKTMKPDERKQWEHNIEAAIQFLNWWRNLGQCKVDKITLSVDFNDVTIKTHSVLKVTSERNVKLCFLDYTKHPPERLKKQTILQLIYLARADEQVDMGRGRLAYLYIPRNSEHLFEDIYLEGIGDIPRVASSISRVWDKVEPSPKQINPRPKGLPLFESLL